MKTKIILCVLFFMVFLPVCKEESPTDPVIPVTLQIEGVVTDSASGQPIENATVYLNEDRLSGWVTLTSVDTDSKGYYFISYKHWKDCGSIWHFVIEVKAGGYLRELKYGGLDDDGPQCTNELQTVNIQLERDR
ncbi:hypothetical protein ACFLT2_03555 [Acidobacteriota bacterium]